MRGAPAPDLHLNVGRSAGDCSIGAPKPASTPLFDTTTRGSALRLAHSSLDQHLSYVVFSWLLLPVRLPALSHANSTKTKAGHHRGSWR